MTTPYRLVTVHDQPELRERVEAITASAWPEFMHHDPVARANWSALYEEFAAFQFVLLDESADIVGLANNVPLAWEGEPEDLPAEGWDWSLAEAVQDARSARQPSVLCGLQVVIPPQHRGKGISAHAIRAARKIATRDNLRAMIVPVRPAWKCHYPLTPMERYIHWKTEEGVPFDPWLRTHVREGGRIAKLCSRSMTIAGSVAEWENWTGMRFPETGVYVVPGALVPVEIDRETGQGRYVEPNVWVWHPVP